MITYQTDKLQKVVLDGGCEQNGTPTPDNPIDIICNNGVVKARHQSGLPLGYQAVEYLESSGEEYIDLGGNLNTSTDDIEIEIQLVQTSGTQFFGARNQSTISVYTLATNEGKWRWGWKDNSTVSDVAIDLNKHILKIDHTNNTLSLDGTVIETKRVDVQNIVTPTTPTLFAVHATSGQILYLAPVRISAFRKWRNGKLVQSVVSCRRNLDNVLGMYDLISNTFLTNAGTGTFTAGNTVSDPIEIYTDGTQEVVTDSLGNTANAERLLAVGDYKDTQEVLSGSVTRNVGIKVLDGTEEWSTVTLTNCYSLSNQTLGNGTITNRTVICSHFGSNSTLPNADARQGLALIGNLGGQLQGYIVGFGARTQFPTIDAWNAFLAQQYASGNPVIVVYPKSSAITETVTGQSLSKSPVTQTAGSIDNLPIESSNIAELMKKRYIGDKEVERVYIGDNLVFGEPPVHNLVDLGLPSGTLWAKGNIVKDANGNYSIGNETDYGCYFSWGNIVGHNEGEGYSFDQTTYNSTPGKQVSADIASNDAAHDAALATLGGSYRMPTKTEFQELCDNTDTVWTTINGVKGRKFMKKSDHSVYIFFPATGGYNGTTHFNLGVFGHYWSGLLYSDHIKGNILFFSSESVSSLSRGNRSDGYAVRAAHSLN